jgi:hypothetical protein
MGCSTCQNYGICRNMVIKKTAANGYWKNGDLSVADTLHTFTSGAQEEVRTLVNSLPPERLDIESINPDEYDLSNFRSEMEVVRDKVVNGPRLAIVGPVEGLNPLEQGVVTWLAGNSLGRPLDQAVTPDGQPWGKIYPLYDRHQNRTRLEGGRYSEDRFGGDSHTDNVNTPERWEFLVLGSIFSAHAGGENGIISGLTMHDLLQSKYPDEYKTLQQPIHWEKKGLSTNPEFYQAPVLTVRKNGSPWFRWLPSYARESAKKALDLGYSGAKPLSDNQESAFRVLEALTCDRGLQFQANLPEGHTAIMYDGQIFHDRTLFTDHPNSIVPELHQRIVNPNAHHQRYRLRMWVQDPEAG